MPKVKDKNTLFFFVCFLKKNSRTRVSQMNKYKYPMQIFNMNQLINRKKPKF